MATNDSTNESTIPAVIYRRMSTDANVKDALGNVIGKSQENSLDQQAIEIAKLKPKGSGSYRVLRSYADAGKSGLSRGEDRPGYSQMRSDCEQRKDVQAILIDDIDRFSREDAFTVMADLQALRSTGVRWIHSANEGQGLYDLGQSGIGEILQLVIVICSSHESSVKTSRRVVLNQIKAAASGIRYGAKIPWGMVGVPVGKNKAGKLKPGDDKCITDIILQIFKWRADALKSLWWISGELMRRHISAPGGGRIWTPQSVKEILERPEYKGDFEPFRRVGGALYRVGPDGEKIDSNGLPPTSQQSPFKHIGIYEAIIPRDLWDRAQKVGNKGRKPRHNGFALSGILICGHCGVRMTAADDKGISKYRCRGPSSSDKKCNCYEIRQDIIMPRIFEVLDREIEALNSMPLVPTRPQSETFQDQTAREIESLEKWISKTQKRILGDMDDDTFKMLTDELKVRKNRLAELKQPKRMDADSDAAQLAAFAEWWDSAKQTMISLEVPTDGQLHTSIAPDTVPMVYDFAADKLSKRSMIAVRVDRRKVQEMLYTLGCQVELWFEPNLTKKRPKFNCVRGRLTLGAKSFELPASVSQRTACR